MKWGIVSDSSCDMYKIKTAEEVSFSTVPFTMIINDKEYVDDESLDIPDMIDAMEKCKTVARTSCPSPQVWVDAFEQADNIIAVTISSNLSGSYNSALTARDIVLDAHPEKRIHIIDSKSAGAEVAMIILHVNKLIKEGKTFAEVVTRAEKYADDKRVLFALLSFDNLVKNGRMNKLVGTVATKLKICGIGISSLDGKIEMLMKVRGKAKVPASIVSSLKFHKYKGGRVMISNCFGEELAGEIKAAIEEKWESAKVTVIATRGLCSFYAERGGLIIGF